ncbi:MAG: hypothetical protein ISS50_00175 [Anaerolineae bacterium]|nr:hypothetical protein [Anaerolineae bacterium]
MTYPNVLVLDYLKRTDQTTPEVQMEAERYIAVGYQRLLTFEVDGGGFSLFGQAPAQLMLTAYGLMEFSDMGRVHYVDPALIQRTAEWLMARQQSDGSWPLEGLTIESGWERLMDSQVPVTAYVVWALAEAGYEDRPEVARGLSYVREHLSLSDDAYALALAANALAAGDPQGPFTRQVLAQLEASKVVEGDRIYWTSSVPSFMGGQGNVASIETTALVAYAMLRAKAYPDVVQGAINYLVSQKDSFGTWQTTQATILSLKAMLLAAEEPGGGEVTVRVSLNGEETDPVQITPENADVVHLRTFTDGARPGDNTVALEIEGEGAVMYQITARYYLPWELIPEPMPGKEALDVRVRYDQTQLTVNEEVGVQVRVTLQAPRVARMVLVDLGLPPGFAVLSEDLDALVEKDIISRYELTGRQIIVYLEDLESGRPVEFGYRLRARFPLRAKVPRSVAYDYYTPDNCGVEAPVEMVVE